MSSLRTVSLYLMVAEANGDNPFQKFLMMGMMGGTGRRSKSNSNVKEEDSHLGGDATNADPKQDDPNPTCVDSSSVVALQSQLEVAIKAQGEAETESRSLASKLTEVQSRIEKLSFDWQKKEEELNRALNAAARIRDKAISERDEMAEDVKRLLDRKAAATVASEAGSDNGARNIEQLESELAEQIKKTQSLEKDHAVLLSELENEKAKEQEDLRKSKGSERNLAAQLDEEKKRVAALEEKHAVFKAQCEAIEQAAVTAIEDQVQTRMASELKRAELEAEQKCQVEYSKLMNSSKLALEQAEARAKSVVAEQKAQTEVQLKELSEKATRERQTLFSKHEKEVKTIRSELDALDAERKRLEAQKLEIVESLGRLELELQKSTEEISYWRDAFTDRAVFNLTHVAETAHDTLALVLDVAGAAVEPGCKYWIEVYEQSIKAVYDSKVRPHVDHVYQQHVKPHWAMLYDDHVKPRVDEIKVAVATSVAPVTSTVVSQSQKVTDASYSLLKENFRNACLHSLTVLKRINGPPDAIERLTWTCQAPEKGIESMFNILSILVLCLFGRTIIRVSARIFLWLLMLVPRTIVSILTLPPPNYATKRA